MTFIKTTYLLSQNIFLGETHTLHDLTVTDTVTLHWGRRPQDRDSCSWVIRVWDETTHPPAPPSKEDPTRNGTSPYRHHLCKGPTFDVILRHQFYVKVDVITILFEVLLSPKMFDLYMQREDIVLTTSTRDHVLGSREDGITRP